MNTLNIHKYTSAQTIFAFLLTCLNVNIDPLSKLSAFIVMLSNLFSFKVNPCNNLENVHYSSFSPKYC